MMSELIMDEREKKEAGNWPQSVKEYGKGWDLTEQWLTEYLLFQCGILSVKAMWLMVNEVDRKET